MFNKDNRVWELNALLSMHMNAPELEAEFFQELQRIADLEPKELEALIFEERPISSIEALEDNIKLYLTFCKGKNIKYTNIR
jgi:hypothetical protein